jgi:hypothetical protein
VGVQSKHLGVEVVDVGPWIFMSAGGRAIAGTFVFLVYGCEEGGEVEEGRGGREGRKGGLLGAR